MRQRVLLLILLLGIVAVASMIAAPKMIHRRARTDPALMAVAVARNQAAAWIRRWVAASQIVACDPLMCRVLLAHGVLAAQIDQLAPTASDPLGAGVVVATAEVRGLMGRRLAAVYAPGVLASYGDGGARVDVRVVASYGAAAYERQLRSDWRARKAAGARLLRNSEISVTAAAAGQIAAGAVDSRLLDILPGLVRFCGPVRILRFGGAGPRHSPGMPLLAADIAPMASYGGVSLARAAARIVTFLKAQWTAVRADRYSERVGPGGRMVVQFDVSAPPQFSAFSGNPVATTPIGTLPRRPVPNTTTTSPNTR